MTLIALLFVLLLLVLWWVRETARQITAASRQLKQAAEVKKPVLDDREFLDEIMKLK